MVILHYFCYMSLQSTFYSRYNTDWIVNTDIGLDPNNSVIKRLRCISNELKIKNTNLKCITGNDSSVLVYPIGPAVITQRRLFIGYLSMYCTTGSVLYIIAASEMSVRTASYDLSEMIYKHDIVFVCMA